MASKTCECTETVNSTETSSCVLRIGDSCLIVGHRMSELMGHAPILEEDLSIANIALELVDQSRAWLTLAGKLEGKGRDEDALAYERAEHQFFNATLAEQPNGHFGDTVARQLMFSGWQKTWYAAATQSTDKEIGRLAKRFLPQAEFHWLWASEWTVRLGDGTDLSHERMQTSIESLWKFTGELFQSDALDEQSAATGLLPLPEDLYKDWHSTIVETLEQARLNVPGEPTLRWFGKRGEHGEELGLLLAEMQSLARAHPGVQW